jgi:hypothetical protein
MVRSEDDANLLCHCNDSLNEKVYFNL